MWLVLEGTSCIHLLYPAIRIAQAFMQLQRPPPYVAPIRVLLHEHSHVDSSTANWSELPYEAERKVGGEGEKKCELGKVGGVAFHPSQARFERLVMARGPLRGILIYNQSITQSSTSISNTPKVVEFDFNCRNCRRWCSLKAAPDAAEFSE